MHLRVLGCHGGETPHHRTSSFLLDGVFGIVAGAVTSQLALDEQSSLKAVAVSHAHFDHVKDLATLAECLAFDQDAELSDFFVEGGWGTPGVVFPAQEGIDGTGRIDF